MKLEKLTLKVRENKLIIELYGHGISFKCSEIEILDLNDKKVAHWKF